MHHFGKFCALALVAGGQAVAGAYDGLWRANPTAECAFTDTPASALKIEDNVLFGVESRCEMTTPVNVRDMEAILYDMACSSEEQVEVDGETQTQTRTWSDRAMFMTAADGGLFLIWNGYAFKYERCPSDAAVGTVATASEIGITDSVDAEASDDSEAD
ncbi:hypothetical protein SAMN04488012_10256 [Palleronia salina]|uniref:Uncharacterized protein n=1 Tax=Palleronia salina TaxID=313368 RepID=A0A1M6CI96_9RHOB|nr:hypothetical protein [Palleronia salina]SHI60750.1 hypothetical protein SAMN04488012_10256 [Palleronia salina]